MNRHASSYASDGAITGARRRITALKKPITRSMAARSGERQTMAAGFALMKILMSALACEPGKGSELEVGFRALLAAASRHEVWVLTNSATIPIVRRAIAGIPWAPIECIWKGSTSR